VLRLGLRGRTSGRRWQARVLALAFAVLLSLMVLDAGAAGWHAWLQRTPALPDIGDATSAGEPVVQGRVPDGLDPDLPGRLPSRAAAGDAGPLRLLVIGESSARGEPYHPWLSVGQIVAWKLESVFVGRPIHLDTWATGGATLAEMHNRLAELTYRPDALLVYVGHNEFQARFPWMRDAGSYYVDEVPSLYSPESLTKVLRVSPFGRLVLETWEQQRVSMRPPPAATRELVDRPVCTAEETGRIAADFQHRLEAIASYCEIVGTLPIFIVPASNDGGYEPSRSVLDPRTPRAERVAFARAVAQARALELKDAAAAMRSERELVERHPEFAETHFRLARLLEQTGDWDLARRHYVLAREQDAMPLRCPEAFRAAYRTVAGRHASVLLVDGPKVLEDQSAHGILDDRLFHDAQHPNLPGYVALAQDVLIRLQRRRAFGWPPNIEAPLVDAGACAAHFGLDGARWSTICSREAAFYQDTAYIRYDPKLRNERAAAYRRAGERIAAGTPPAESGIPGGWLLPRPALGSSFRAIPSSSTRTRSW
jgi:hypothetical protein